MTDLSATPDEVAKQNRNCGDCGYRITNHVCPECGGGPLGPIDGNLLLERRTVLGRFLVLIKIAMVIEIILLVATLVMPALRVVPMNGGLMTILRAGTDLLLVSTPGIFAAIATRKVLDGPWSLTPATKISLRIACLLFLLYPVCQILNVVWVFSPTVMLEGIIEWGYSMYSFTIFAGTVILIRSLGICSQQDPGGAERWFLRHAWIGAVGLAILYETTMLALGRIWSSMAATGIPAGWGIDAVLFLSRAIAVGFILYVLSWVLLMMPWKRILVISTDTAKGA